MKISEATRSAVFGGNIFTPIKGAESGAGGLKETRNDGKAISKGNRLGSEISQMQIGPQGGYFEIFNVKVNSKTFYDIQILIDGSQMTKSIHQKMLA